MIGMVDWAASRARMVMAFIVVSVLAGAFAYLSLPKEGEPDIEIPALIISLPFQGISAEDAEKLLIKPMETVLADVDGLDKMTATALDNYAVMVLEFEFGWDKGKTLADVRDRMSDAEADFPDGGDQYTISEFNFSQFPIVIVSLSGDLPERTLLRQAKALQDRIEALEPVLSADLAGHRDEMLEVIIDPLKLEAYNVTAGELIGVVVNNNQLIPAGSVSTETSDFAIKIPSSFDNPRDIYSLPVKTNGDRVITLGDIAEIRLTFEDREGTARFNGDTTVALQIVKRKGFNLIDTAALVKAEVAAFTETWPEELKAAISVRTSNDQSRVVDSMVRQLEGSVLTAIALVMMVVLAALGTRSALLVGFAIPTSFLLCFAFFAVMGISVSNIVMFGLILAVGMLVDGAIVVVEYADKRIREGTGPMAAYTEAAKRMFWPIVSSTATTLCAFLPMLFWPGVPGQFMGMLPVTLIFVLSASLVVALIYLPVLGGVSGRLSRFFANCSEALRKRSILWRLLFLPVALYVLFVGAMQTLNPAFLFGPDVGTGLLMSLPGALIFLLGAALSSIAMGALEIRWAARRVKAKRGRTPFGRFTAFIVNNPYMPLAVIATVIVFVMSTFSYFGANNKGVEFFVDTEPEQAIVYVRARGNLSLEEKDALMAQAEEVIINTPGVQSTFSFAGNGGLNANTGGAGPPLDTIGQAQLELVPWEDRPSTGGTAWIWGLIPWTSSTPDPNLGGRRVMADIQAGLDAIPGIQTEILNLARGPASAKPVHLRLRGDDWEALQTATARARAAFETTPGLIDIEDSLPLPGIDWQINVDVEKAGRFGADVTTVGAMVQLVTRGLLLDTMRVDSSDEEIEIRVRLPQEDRVLSTLDRLKVRTREGLVPLANFITREPVAKLGQINRIGQSRYFDVKAAVEPNLVLLSTMIDGEPISYGILKEVEPGVSPEISVAGKNYRFFSQTPEEQRAFVETTQDRGSLMTSPVNPNQRIEALTEWLAANPLHHSVEWEWTGDSEEQAESQAFLSSAFSAALALMFIILLAQFNSLYNSMLVLLAVVMSTAGVLIGMLVMDQAFSIIMTGTGIVALAGIVVNNNIVLIDTYQEYSRFMPRIEAIIRTAEARIRPVFLTTVTTMAGLTPMMFGLSLDFQFGGYSIDAPTALWWKQLATAVVFGLGIATALTLVFTPAMLALRVWAVTYVAWFWWLVAKIFGGRQSQAARDWALEKEVFALPNTPINWEDEPVLLPAPAKVKAIAGPDEGDEAEATPAE